MSIQRIIVCVAFGFGTFVAVSSHASIVTLNSGVVTAQAQKNGGGNVVTSLSLNSTFTSAPLTATNSDSKSDNLVSLISGSGQSVLTFDIIKQIRSGTSGASNGSIVSTRADGQVSSAPIKFQVITDTTYALSGEYAVQDDTSAGNNALLSVILTDLTDSVTLFSSSQSAKANPDVSFSLSGAGLGGSLFAGKIYQLSISAASSNGLNEGESTATASGKISLAIADSTEPGAVPEATSSLIWGLLGVTFAAGGWGRRCIA
jgi:hypothetical protein